MNFELEPDNRGATDDMLLGDLRAVAANLGKVVVTRDEYEHHGRFHPKTLVKRFGSWNSTLVKAGLKVAKPHLVSAGEYVADIQRVAADLRVDALSTKQYLQHGSFSLKPLSRLFGTWGVALERAGLRPGPGYNTPLTDAELLENLETVWRTLGRQPKQSDMRKPLSRVTHDVYCRRFGNWRAALQHFVSTVSGESTPKAATAPSSLPIVAPVPGEDRSVATRIAGWRLRFLVMRRDRFCCCQCGASPALSLGTVLVVDHIIPWSQGGTTTLDNLQTLCEPCNGGKSDLPASVGQPFA
jgi:hypothetical protein